ncbi:SDH4, succinate dehydrogenase subunit 4 [Phytophthora megakarya]|uniref:Succinate dehydrogenase [ubiquinone] cytochrome b small subunit n=1 Tax=Phytophthora megakarya TaxID=4795 RepID=A0A225WU41_9STRA|nr:SDH4, succinate dehydrogenase subunit 4 [Phytophthora megakarya]
MMHRSVMRTGSVLTKRPSGVRHFRQSRPTKYTENKEVTGLAGIVEADNHKLSVKLQHLTSVALMGAVPLAFVLSPSPLVLPVDLAMGVILPVHAHIGMNNVISDYVPKNMRTLVRLGWLGATSLMFLGLLRVNLEGPGITEVVKTVWRESPNKKQEA